jgi:outer membrane protein
MKNSIRFSFLTFILVILSYLNISAQNQKIAYVDVDAITPNMPETKAAKSELEQFKAILQKQLEGEQAKAQQYYTDVMTKIQQGVLAPAQQKAEEEKLMKMQEELQKKALKMEEDMAAKQEELFKPLEEKFKTALSSVAKTGGFAYILDKKLLLYSDGGEDVTSKVKAQLGVQ